MPARHGPFAAHRRRASLVIASIATLLLGLLTSAATAEQQRPLPDTGSVAGDGLVLDAAGMPAIVFQEDTPGGVNYQYDIFVVRCNDPDCADGDDRGQLVVAATQLSWWSAMVLTSDGNPVVMPGNGTLVSCNDPACAGGDESVRLLDDPSPIEPFFVLTIDAEDNPVVGYAPDCDPYPQDVSPCQPGGWDNHGSVALLRCDGPTCDGPDTTTTFVPETQAFTDFAMVLDAAGNPIVVSNVGDGLVLVRCNDPICVGDDETEVLLDPTFPDFWDWISQGQIAVAVDADDNPVVIWADGNTYDAEPFHLTLMHCNDPHCQGGDDFARVVARTPGVGLELSMSGNNPVILSDHLLRCNDPFCSGGGDTTTQIGGSSMVLDAVGHPVIASSGGGGLMTLIHCDDPACDPDIGGEPVPTCDGKPATIVGTNGNDRLVGTNGADAIVGLGGHDELIGYGGNDTLCGNDGNDRLVGHGGNDALFGGNGSDRLFGNAGKDRLYGNNGNDTIWAGSQDDQLFGGDGDDRLDGSGGNDTVVAGRGNDHVTGGSGVDLLLGGEHDDRLVGGGGNDTVRGNSGNDTLRGDAGNDDLDGGWGPSDSADGGTGTDRCVAETRTTCET